VLEERRPGWQANIKLDSENGWEGVDWTKPAQDGDHYRALANTAPWNVHNFLINWERRPGWQANIKLDSENGWEGVDWTKPAQDGDHYRALANTAPWNVHNFLINWETINFETEALLCCYQTSSPFQYVRTYLSNYMAASRYVILSILLSLHSSYIQKDWMASQTYFSIVLPYGTSLLSFLLRALSN
jgi:hypothetical protein